MKKTTRCCDTDIEIGIIMILAGVAFLLERFGVLRFDDILKLWPLAPIAAGFRLLLAPGASRSAQENRS